MRLDGLGSGDASSERTVAAGGHPLQAASASCGRSEVDTDARPVPTEPADRRATCSAQRLRAPREVPAAGRARAAVPVQPRVRGCGKIQHPEHVLRRRMPVEQAIGAIEECGAPMVSIAGGEPLIHPEIHVIAAELIKRKKFVFLCTNALLMERKLDLFKPSPYFAWAVHIDGLRERHDQFGRPRRRVRQGGRGDPARRSGAASASTPTRPSSPTTRPRPCARCSTSSTTSSRSTQMMISPAYAYEKAPDQEHFLGVDADARAVPRGVRRRPAQALAAEPHAAVPRLPRGQGRLPVHAVGDPELLAVRLAAALLPDGGRLREDLQGAARDDRLVEVRPRQATRAATTAWRTAATSRPP